LISVYLDLHRDQQTSYYNFDKNKIL